MSDERIFRIRITVEIEEDGREAVRQQWCNSIAMPPLTPRSYIPVEERDDIVISRGVENVVRQLVADIRGRLR